MDPKTNEVRRIPFEVMVVGDRVPVYEETLEDNGRFNEQPVLPFNAFGTLAVGGFPRAAHCSLRRWIGCCWALPRAPCSPTRAAAAAGGARRV